MKYPTMLQQCSCLLCCRYAFQAVLSIVTLNLLLTGLLSWYLMFNNKWGCKNTQSGETRVKFACSFQVSFDLIVIPNNWTQSYVINQGFGSWQFAINRKSFTQHQSPDHDQLFSFSLTWWTFGISCWLRRRKHLRR